MRYRLALFDFDGTLADSFPWFLEAVNLAAARYRFGRIEEHETETLRGLGARHVMRHLGMAKWKIPLVAGFLRKHMTRQIDKVSLFPGVDVLLEGLARKGVTLAIVSSNSEANIRRVLGPDLAGLIRYYEGGAPIFGKAGKLRKVLRASGVPAAEAICIGDELRDLDAARAEGIAFGAVAWGATRLDALVAAKPEEVFLEVGEVLGRVG